LKSVPETVRHYIHQKLAGMMMASIETKITEAEAGLKADKKAGYRLGETLYRETKNELSHLQVLLGVENAEYSMTSDHLAKKLLECSIEYFNSMWESDTDPGEEVLRLYNHADEIAIGALLKDRIEENRKSLLEWIEDKPHREKKKKIQPELTTISEVVEEVRNSGESLEIAKALVKRCKSALKKIKKILGKEDELYLRISSNIASYALNILINVVNKKLETRSNNASLPSLYAEAWEAFILINTLDMNSGFRTRYNENKDTLRNACNLFNVDASMEKPVSNTEAAMYIIGLILFSVGIADLLFNDFQIIKNLIRFIQEQLSL
jgi:hypothetical protein